MRLLSQPLDHRIHTALFNKTYAAENAGIGHATTFRVVRNENGLVDRVEFTPPQPEPKPTAKQFAIPAEYKMQKALYRARTALVLRDTLVVALTKRPPERVMMDLCIKGLLSMKLNLDAYNWNMAPNVNDKMSDAERQAEHNMHLDVALLAVRGINTLMDTHGSAKNPLSKKELGLLEKLKSGLEESIARLSLPVQPRALPAPPREFVRAMGMNDEPLNPSQPPSTTTTTTTTTTTAPWTTTSTTTTTTPLHPASTTTVGTAPLAPTTSSPVSRRPPRTMHSGYDSE